MKTLFKMTLFKKIFIVIFSCLMCVEGIHMYVDYQSDNKERLSDVLDTRFVNLNTLAARMMELSPDAKLSAYSERLFEQYIRRDIMFDFGHNAANVDNYQTFGDFRGGVDSFIMYVNHDPNVAYGETSINLKSLDKELLKEIDTYLYNNRDKDIVVEVDFVEDEAKTIVVGEEYKLDNDEYILTPVERDCYSASYLKLNDWVVFGEGNDVEKHYLYSYTSDELLYFKRGYFELDSTIECIGECYYFDDQIDKVKNIIDTKKNLIALEDNMGVKRYAYIDKEHEVYDMVYYIFDVKIHDSYPSSYGPEYYNGYTYACYPAFACTVTFGQSVKAKLDVYVIAFVVSVIASLLISYMLTKRIKTMEKQTKEIAKNHFDVRLEEKYKDELGDLSVSINKMSSNLKETIDQLNQEIQQVKKLESLRKDFINQFTHEIKTPLGIINGYSELIEVSEDESEKQRYLSLINEETERINKLVLSMLKLSRLEAGKVELHKEDIDLEYLTVNVIDEFEVLLKKKNIKVIVNCVDSHIFGDKEHLITVIRNFISNAIKHTDSKIVITINKGVSVYNEGKHIDEDKLEGIWYTFVTHDKSGTGLGLAIVRSILELHNYSYGVTNKDNGVEFYFNE